MDPQTVFDLLTKAGPWAVAVILTYWLVLERKERIESQKEVITLLRQSATDKESATKAMGELGEATRERLKENDQKLESAIDKIESSVETMNAAATRMASAAETMNAAALANRGVRR